MMPDDSRTMTRAGATTAGIGVPPVQLGTWIFLATVTMLFAAFCSAYVIRRAGAGWTPIAMPLVLWLNTALLVGSSLTLEAARSAGRREGATGAPRWVLATTGLGLLFLVGQVIAWRQLVTQGIYVPTSPHSAFFYIFTGLHGLHLLGGIAFLLYLSARLARGGPGESSGGDSRLITPCATYWHFLGALWILLFVVLSTI